MQVVETPGGKAVLVHKQRTKAHGAVEADYWLANKNSQSGKIIQLQHQPKTLQTRHQHRRKLKNNQILQSLSSGFKTRA